jgi:hypothetical protein
MQVPVVDDVPPSSAPDVFVVPYNSQSRLPVLANDTAAYVSLALTQTTSPCHGLIAMDTNASSILYTPRYRFNGFDRLLYSAKDLKGRDVTDSVLVSLYALCEGYEYLHASDIPPELPLSTWLAQVSSSVKSRRRVSWR